MRLLNTTTLQLESFIGDDSRPEYAILSHTWGAEEVLYEDMETSSPGSLPTTKAGRTKIIESCARAEQDGFQYIWIDTCCIDKSSSAELSEAINSMFRWYRDARLCYAYLVDITSDQSGDQFGASRWFTRGWTLQELISPPEIHFYNQDWSFIGTRHGLAERISNITGIGIQVLARTAKNSAALLRMELNVTSVSTRMAWAAERFTTRVEDMAYCLMGIFDVNMPLLYGEGHKAFRRLQEEIVTSLNDQSILVWTPRTHDEVGPNFFAPDPRVNFETGVSSYPQSHHPQSLTLSNKGLEVDVLLGFASFEGYDRWVAILNCHSTDDFLKRPGLLVDKVSREDKIYVKSMDGILWISGDSVGKRQCTALWRVDQGPPRQVMLSISKTERTTILLQHDKRLPSTITSPPLRVSLGSSSSIASYRLFASTQPERDGYIAPWSPPTRRFWVAPAQGARGIGTIFIRNDAEPPHGFFIFWGVEMYPMSDMFARDQSGRSWWDRSQPTCAILSWADVMGNEPITAAGTWTEAEVFHQFIQSDHPPISLNGRSSRKEERKVGTVTVEAKIRAVDCFDRRAFQLTVAIS